MESEYGSESEYAIEGPDKDGDYTCLDCGHYFAVPEGEPVECPVCRQLRNYPPLKPCPFCGTDHVILDWEIRSRMLDGNHHQIQARCMRCNGGQTDLFDTAEEAMARWNRRDSRGLSENGKLKPCPFCGWMPKIEETVDEEDFHLYYYAVVCPECGCRTYPTDGVWRKCHATPDEDDYNEVVELWNRRTIA